MLFIEPLSNIIIPLDLEGYKFQKVLRSSHTHVLYSALGPNNKPVIVYFFDTQRLSKAGMLEAVLKRLDEMKSLQHKNIASVLLVHSDEDWTYMVVEDYPDLNLENYIVTSPKFSENEVLRIAKSLFDAFSYIHSKQICHGDLKPECIQMDGNMDIKITGFTFSQQTLNAVQKRTPAQMNLIPPEVLLETGFDPFALDIWCLGVIVFIMATKKLPFNEKNQIKLFNRIIACKYTLPFCVNPLINDIISTCVVADAKKRSSAARIALLLRGIKVEKHKNKLSKTALQAKTYVSGYTFSRIEAIAKRGNIQYRRKTFDEGVPTIYY